MNNRRQCDQNRRAPEENRRRRTERQREAQDEARQARFHRNREMAEALAAQLAQGAQRPQLELEQPPFYDRVVEFHQRQGLEPPTRQEFVAAGGSLSEGRQLIYPLMAAYRRQVDLFRRHRGRPPTEEAFLAERVLRARRPIPEPQVAPAPAPAPSLDEFIRHGFIFGPDRPDGATRIGQPPRQPQSVYELLMAQRRIPTPTAFLAPAERPNPPRLPVAEPSQRQNRGPISLMVYDAAAGGGLVPVEMEFEYPGSLPTEGALPPCD